MLDGLGGGGLFFGAAGTAVLTDQIAGKGEVEEKKEIPRSSHCPSKRPPPRAGHLLMTMRTRVGIQSSIVFG